VEAGIARIERTPDLYAVADENTRRARLRRFPFAIYYEVEADQRVVFAVWHHRRDPRGWQQRAR
jgi:plasmid stabilization system protein ParE